MPCACERCVLTSFSLKNSENFVTICWVRIDQRVGYELTESGYETSDPGYESSGYETTGYRTDCFDILKFSLAIRLEDTNRINMFIHFFCLSPPGRTIKLSRKSHIDHEVAYNCNGSGESSEKNIFENEENIPLVGMWSFCTVRCKLM